MTGLVFQKLRLGGQLSGYWLLVGWLALVFLMGGSARADTSSLPLLRPMSVLMTAAGLFLISRRAAHDHRSAIIGLAAIAGLAVAHLVPLPPALWHFLPKRELIVAIDGALALDGQWRPLSIAPDQTLNALMSLFVPASVLLFAASLSDGDLKRLSIAVLGLGFVSMLLAILQQAGGEQSALYMYRIHTEGAPVGLFANRNHQAVFLASLIPLLAAQTSSGDRTGDAGKLRALLGLAAGVVVTMLLLLTGSRAGLALGALAICSTPLVYQGNSIFGPGLRKYRGWLISAGVALIAILVALAVAAGRTEALDRLLASSDANEYRVTTFQPLLQLAGSYLPFGSGIGSFVEAWFEGEPERFLEPRYLNHAHNELLEIALTAGIPGLLLLLVVMWYVGQQAYGAFAIGNKSDQHVRIARSAAIAIAILALASVVDYPLRTPAMMAYLAILIVWLQRPMVTSRRKLGG